MEVLTEDIVKKLGFKPVPHFTIMNSYNYDLGRNRRLSIGCIGEPNEMLFMTQQNREDIRVVDDIICLSNYDYDGYLTEEKLQDIISSLTSKK